jgi:hypothetical protein
VELVAEAFLVAVEQVEALLVQHHPLPLQAHLAMRGHFFHVKVY